MDAVTLSDCLWPNGASEHLFQLLIDGREESSPTSNQTLVIQPPDIEYGLLYCLRMKDKHLPAGLALKYKSLLNDMEDEDPPTVRYFQLDVTEISGEKSVYFIPFEDLDTFDEFHELVTGYVFYGVENGRNQDITANGQVSAENGQVPAANGHVCHAAAPRPPPPLRITLIYSIAGSERSPPQPLTEHSWVNFCSWGSRAYAAPAAP